jgi:hypothetical protein
MGKFGTKRSGQAWGCNEIVGLRDVRDVGAPEEIEGAADELSNAFAPVLKLGLSPCRSSSTTQVPTCRHGGRPRPRRRGTRRIRGGHNADLSSE